MSETENEKVEGTSPETEPEEIVSESPSETTESTELVEAEPSEVEAPEDEEEDEPIPPREHKFSEKQIKVIQIILGLISGAVIWLSIGIGSSSDNVLLQYLFVIVFAVIMILQRTLENKLQVSTRTFVKFWLISLVICLAIFIVYGVTTGAFNK